MWCRTYVRRSVREAGPQLSEFCQGDLTSSTLGQVKMRCRRLWQHGIPFLAVLNGCKKFAEMIYG